MRFDKKDNSTQEKRFMRFEKKGGSIEDKRFMRFNRKDARTDDKRFMRFDRMYNEPNEAKRFMRFNRQYHYPSNVKRFIRFDKKRHHYTEDKRFMRFDKKENLSQKDKRFMRFDKKNFSKIDHTKQNPLEEKNAIKEYSGNISKPEEEKRYIKFDKNNSSSGVSSEDIEKNPHEMTNQASTLNPSTDAPQQDKRFLRGFAEMTPSQVRTKRDLGFSDDFLHPEETNEQISERFVQGLIRDFGLNRPGKIISPGKPDFQEQVKRFMRGFQPEKKFMRDLTAQKRFMRGFEPDKRFMRGFGPEKRFMRGFGAGGFGPGKRFMRGYLPDKRFMRGLRLYPGYSSYGTIYEHEKDISPTGIYSDIITQNLDGNQNPSPRQDINENMIFEDEQKRFMRGFSFYDKKEKGAAFGSDAQMPEFSSGPWRYGYSHYNFK